MESKQPSRAHRQLIRELKRIREEKGLSGNGLGDVLGWSQSKVSKIERARTRPSVADVRAWAEACTAPQGVVRELLELAEEAASESRSWSEHHGSLAMRNSAIARNEHEMTGMRNFQPAVFPGLLQTADYARRVIALLDVAGTADMAAAVAVRMERQAVLYDTTKSFEFIMTEAAVRWRPGPYSLMLAQLDRLKSVGTLPNVTIRILPLEAEATSLCLGGFTIFDIPDEPYVLIECLSGEHKLYAEADVSKYSATIERLRRSAVTGADAWALIDTIKAEFTERMV